MCSPEPNGAKPRGGRARWGSALGSCAGVSDLHLDRSAELAAIITRKMGKITKASSAGRLAGTQVGDDDRRGVMTGGA